MKMGTICLLLLFFLPQLLHAQHRTFLRLYNDNGNNINKGYLFATTDSSIVLYKGDNKVEIPVLQIGFIKSKRGTAHRILSMSLTVAAIVTIIPAVILYLYIVYHNNRFIPYRKSRNVNPDITTEKVKLARKYNINGSLDTWQTQRILLNRLL